MSKKGSYIKLKSGVIKELARKEGVSEQTVYAALRYETNSAKAVKIRAMALQPERGGVKYLVSENKYENAKIL